VRIYPDPKDPGRSISQFGYYFDAETLAANPAEAQKFPQGFTQVVVSEDFALAETTQRTLASGLQREVLFGRNELPLQHYHDTFRRALGMEPLPRLDEA